MQHLVNHSDLAFVLARGYQPKGWCPGVRNDAGAITPNVTTMIIEPGRYVSVFHVKPIYYETVTGHWRPLSEVCEYHGNRKIILKPEALRLMSPQFMRWLSIRQQQMGSELLFAGIGVQPRHMVFATTTTVYPDPHAETNTYDGYLSSDQNASWDVAHDDTVASTASDSATLMECTITRNGNNTRRIDRDFILFDTSGISSGDTISAASFTWTAGNTPRTWAGGWDDTNDSVCLVQVQGQNISSDTSIATSDFPYCGDAVDNPTEGTDSGERVDVTSVDASTGYTMDLNSTGMGWIAKSGETKPSGATSGITYIGLRLLNDVTDTDPTGALSAGNGTIQQIYTAENTGTSNDPVLVVEHAAGGGGGDNRPPRWNIWW